MITFEGKVMSVDNGIKVCCRFRPINKVEASERSVNAVSLTDTTVNVQVGAASNHDFAFDRVFQPGAFCLPSFICGLNVAMCSVRAPCVQIHRRR